jgi:hypothetical protein
MKIMKRSEILLQANKINQEETPKIARAGKLLRYLFFFIAFSWITLLSSCAVENETPYYGYESFGVIVDPWDYHWRHDHREWIHQHPHWRHEYPRHHEGHR